jgi:hypothetical protein
MSLRDSLQAIYDQRGELTPALVVDLARPEDHPLHDRFEWNDAIAGEVHRREQARRLIRSVKITDNRNPKRPRHIREFVSVSRGTDPQPTYMPTVDAVADEFTRALVLQAMERDIAALKRKYSHLKEFAAAINALAKGA